MSLDEKIETITKEKPSFLNKSINFLRRKLLPYTLVGSTFFSTVFGLSGCTDTAKLEIITKSVGKRKIEKGKIRLRDPKGNEFSLEVYDEYTSELINGLEVYVISNSTEVLIEYPEGRYLPHLFAFDKLKEELFKIKLPKISDLRKENRPLFTLNPCPINMDWNENTEKINKEPVPLSKIYEFYQENETDGTKNLIELGEGYCVSFTLAKELLVIRDAMLEYSNDISNIIGINTNEILFDIYREPISGLLYHKRVDNNPAGNIAPLICNLDVISEKNKLNISFKLSDANADICSIDVIYTTNLRDMHKYKTATTDPKECKNLESSLTGINHTITWIPKIDLTSDIEKVWVSLKATDSKGKTRSSPTSKYIDVSNLTEEIYSTQGLDLSTPELALKSYLKAIKERDLESIFICEGYTEEEVTLIKKIIPKKELDSIAKKGETPKNIRMDTVKTKYTLYENEELACVQTILTFPDGSKKATYTFLANHYGNWIAILSGDKKPAELSFYDKHTTPTKTASRLVEKSKESLLERIKNFKENLHNQDEQVPELPVEEQEPSSNREKNRIRTTPNRRFLEKLLKDPLKFGYEFYAKEGRYYLGNIEEDSEEKLNGMLELYENISQVFPKTKIEEMGEKRVDLIRTELKYRKKPKKYLEEDLKNLNEFKKGKYQYILKKINTDELFSPEIEGQNIDFLKKLLKEYSKFIGEFPNTKLAKIAEKRSEQIKIELEYQKNN